MRSFLALPLPDAVRAAILPLQGAVPFGRAVPEENLHLTLAFLGDAPLPVLEEIDAHLRSLRLPAPEVRFGGLDTFGDMAQGLVFIAVAADPVLTGLHGKLAQVARAAGIDLPRRRFRPHVTILRSAKAPKGIARDRLAAALGMPVHLPAFTARRVTLYESRLSSTGARHFPLADYPLG
jgi:2'-5' RNA ligase